MSVRKRKQFAFGSLDRLLRAAAASLVPETRPLYWRLIAAVRSRSQLLLPRSNRSRREPDPIARIVRACTRLSERSNCWVREPEAWRPPQANPRAQFRSLVSHLLDRYSVPRFMIPVWHAPEDPVWGVDLYLHLAAGRDIRQFALPRSLRPTRRAAAFFLQAPEDLPPQDALRWGQVRALGGDERLARALAAHPRPAAAAEDGRFWEDVIRFLVKHQPIAPAEAVAILRFVDQQRFQPAEEVWGPGAGSAPLQPEFRIRGRSLRSLRRHMAHWREELVLQRPTLIAATRCWARSDIGPFRFTDGDLLWTIEELLTDRALRVEGGMMKHCVGGYVRECAQRLTSIWSMKAQQGERRKRVLTIEVLPRSRIIWEARGKRNVRPTPQARKILQRWADREGLLLYESNWT